MEEDMSRMKRQLRLYELVCGYAITSFQAIEQEVFPYKNIRMIQRDLKDLKDAGLIAVKYSRKGQGYIKEKKDNEAYGEIREYVTAKDFLDHCFKQDDFPLGWVEAPDVIEDDYLNGEW